MKHWELLLRIKVGHKPSKKRVPGNPCKVRKRALIADKVRRALLLQVGIDDAEYAADLVGIALLSRE